MLYNKSNITLILENMPSVAKNISLASSGNIFCDLGRIFQYWGNICYLYSKEMNQKKNVTSTIFKKYSLKKIPSANDPHQTKKPSGNPVA